MSDAIILIQTNQYILFSLGFSFSQTILSFPYLVVLPECELCRLHPCLQFAKR